MAPDERSCPQCAETIKAAATLCRFCRSPLDPVAAEPFDPDTYAMRAAQGSSFDVADAIQRGAVGFGNLGCLGIAIVFGILIALSRIYEAPSTDAEDPDATNPPLAASVVTQCESYLAKLTGAGIARRRAGDTLEVDEAAWAALPADLKKSTLSSLSCAHFKRAAPPAGANAVFVRGYHDGVIHASYSKGLIDLKNP